MKLKNLSKEELESMGYDDIAYKILEEENKKLKLPDLFKKICKLLELDESEYENRIGDFFQLISRDQRFKMLDKGYWDLKEKYQTQIILDNEDDEELAPEDGEEDLDMNEPEDDSENDTYYDEDSEDDDPEDDDLKDLVIISDDEDDEANLS